MSRPLTDAEVGPIEGLLSEYEIKEQLKHLSEDDTRRVQVIYEAQARRLGSYPAARVWLLTKGGGWDGTPLDAIINGNADLVLEYVDASLSQNPPYA